MSGGRLPLRIITYLVPSLPVELFEIIGQYLENALQCETMMFYESRFTGPQADRVDPFRMELADIAFISSGSYQLLKEQKNKDWELLPVGAIHSHITKGESLGYYADIIIHRDMVERTTDFYNLRGAKWATSDPASLSGHLIMLKMLKEKGENTSFFGNVLNSKSHLGSIQMVALKQADVASVDSVALALALEKNPSWKDDIHVFDTIGPLPPYPVMVRASLPSSTKEAITKALLNLRNVHPWNERCSAYRLHGFKEIDDHVFNIDRDTRELVASLSASIRYY